MSRIDTLLPIQYVLIVQFYSIDTHMVLQVNLEIQFYLMDQISYILLVDMLLYTVQKIK